MRRFHFSLEKLLRLRRAAEEQEKLRLAVAWRECRREEEALARYRADLDAWQDGLLARSRPLPELLHGYTYLDGLRRRVERQEERLAEARTRLEESRARAARAIRQRQVLERLRERRLADYLYQWGREERKLLDEAGNAVFLRRRG